MSEGVYNVLFIGGLGDIRAATQPFYEARLLAQKAYALQRGGPLPYSDNDPAPAAGEFVSNAMNFYTQEVMFVRLKQYRYLLTMQDVTRASIPFPDNQFMEYPDADWWRYISEKRIKRWGKAVDLFDRDPKTKQILEKLDEPISMSFANETPLDDVLKYIKQATTDADVQRHPHLRRSDRAPGSRALDELDRCRSTSKACPSRRPSGSSSSSSAWSTPSRTAS